MIKVWSENAQWSLRPFQGAYFPNNTETLRVHFTDGANAMVGKPTGAGAQIRL